MWELAPPPPDLVDVNGFQGQLAQTLSPIPVALRGGGYAPTPSLASRSVLKVHDAGLGASGDRKKPTLRPRYPGLISAKAAVSPRACARPTKRSLPGAKASAFRVCAGPADGLPSSVGGRERSVGAQSARAHCSDRTVSLRPKSSGAGYRDKRKALGFTGPGRRFAHRGVL